MLPVNVVKDDHDKVIGIAPLRIASYPGRLLLYLWSYVPP